MKTRDDLIRHINDERAGWRALLAEVGEERMEEPGPMGDWTFKDLSAHLLGWRDRTLDLIEAGPGGNPPTPWPASMDTDDEINAWIHEQHRDRPLADVLADTDRSYERLATQVAAMSDEDLLTPGRFEWMGGRALVEGDFFGHLHEEHDPSIREWLQSR
jgi:uncharacterized protein (TIGR03083 family)